MKRPVFLGWWQVAAAFLNQSLGSAAVTMCYSVIAVPLEKAFAPSYAVLMLGATMRSLVSGLAGPVLGAAMDRYSLRHIMLAGAFLLVGGFLAISFTTSIVQVIVVYAALLSLAVPATGPLSYTVHLPRWFARRRARALAIAAMGFSLGTMILPPLLQYLIDSFEWRVALRIFAAGLFVLMVPNILWVIVDRPSDRGLYPDGDSEPPPNTAQNRQHQHLPTAAIFRDSSFWLITVVMALLISGSGGFISNLLPFAISIGFTASQGAFAISCFAVGSFSSMILFAAFGDRISPRIGLAASLLSFALCCVCYLHADAYPILLVGGFLQGLGMGGVQPLWSFLVARVFGPTNVARVFGLMLLLLTPPALLAHPLMGRIYDVTGSYDYGFKLFLGLFLLAILLLPRIRVDAAAPKIQNRTVG